MKAQGFSFTLGFEFLLSNFLDQCIDFFKIRIWIAFCGIRMDFEDRIYFII
ncbi:MAG TPA: hypothetical protein VIO11_09715 [Candidatus Methanoperedens sp.]